MSNSMPYGFTLGELSWIERPNWIIKDFLVSSVCLVGGPSGCGKSTFLSQLAYSVITGKRFLDYFDVLRKGHVLYIDLERFENTAFYFRELFSHEKDFEEGSLHILDDFNLTDDSDFTLLRKYLVSDPQIVLVVLDSLQVSHDKKENANEEMNMVMSRLREIKNYTNNAAVIALQHTRKMSRDMLMNPVEAFRGASSIGQRADIGYVISNTKDFAIKRVDTAKFNVAGHAVPSSFFFKFEKRFGCDLYDLRFLTEEDANLNNSLANSLFILIPKLLRDEELSRHQISGLLKDSGVVVSVATLTRALRDLESVKKIYQPKHGFYKKVENLQDFSVVEEVKKNEQ